MTYRSWIFLILATGLLLCTAVDLFYFPHTLIFPDEGRFMESAQMLVTTGEFRVGSDRAFEMPGTAIFLSAFVYLFGPDAAVVPARVAQGFLVAIQAVLIGHISFRIFHDKRAALIAIAITSLYPFLMYFQGLLLSETLFNTLLVAGFASLYWWHARCMRIDISLLVTCIIFVAAVMTKATLMILPPLLLAALALAETRKLWSGIRALIVSAVIYCALLAPWWTRNYSLFGQFVPFTTSAGLNLYLGNNSANHDGGIDWTHDVEPERFKAMTAIPNEIDRSRAYSKAGIDYIAQNPAEFIKLMGLKFLRYWNPAPNAGQFRSIVFVLISAFSFIPILVFAIISAIRNCDRFAILLPIYLLIAYFTFVHVIVIASLRYRLPLEPFLIMLAAEPIAWILAKFTKQAMNAESS